VISETGTPFGSRRINFIAGVDLPFARNGNLLLHPLADKFLEALIVHVVREDLMVLIHSIDELFL
jgi:hypothetical protein